MVRFSFLLVSDDHVFELIAALIGILSMVVARLMDWYFPSKHHRKLDDDQDEDDHSKE